MHPKTISLAAAVLVLTGLGASAQPSQSGQAARPSAPLDAGAIRRQASQLTELRALLADPDPNVRLLTIRQALRSPDPVQRQVAMDAGLSSAETLVQEVTLRTLLADRQQIVIALSNPDGSPISDGVTGLNLEVTGSDADTGKMVGRNWTGQLIGGVFSYIASNGASGSLVWEPDAGEFRGTVNVSRHSAKGLRRAALRLR